MDRTLLWIVFGVLCGAITLLPIVFVIYRMRFYIWQGWYRGIFLCEDGDVITRTIRPKADDKKVEFKVKGVLGMYDKVETAIRRTTRAHIPTALYIAGQSSPLVVKGKSLADLAESVDAPRYRQVARSTIARDLLFSFLDQKISTIMALLLLTGVVLIGFVALGIFVNSKISELGG